MELLEREGQLGELQRLLGEAAAGTGKLVFLGGEAGAGKSALAEEFVRRCRREAGACWGHADALETSRILGPVYELAAGLRVPLPNIQGAAVAREELFAPILAQLAPPNPPRVVVLEDLHWADEATLDFLRYVGRRVQRTRALLIVAYRDDALPSTHPLRRLLGELTGDHVQRMRLPPLTLDAVSCLASGTSRDAEHTYEITGGNPFFVREVLSAPSGTVPETVRDAVLARLGQCSAAAREAAELASLVPGRIETWVARELLADAGPPVDECVARGLLQRHGDAFGFRHELGRRAVEEAMPYARAQQLHQRILKCLIDRQADLSRLVHHAARADDIDSLLEYAPRAALEAARAGSHREAVAHFGLALRHAAMLPLARKAWLYEMHAVECDITLEVGRAIESGTRALELWRELEDLHAQSRMLLLLARQFWKSGRKAQTDRHVDRAIELLEPLPPCRDLALAYSARSQFAMTSDRTQLAFNEGHRALALAEKLGDHATRSHALNNIGAALMTAGEDSGLPMLKASLKLALEHNLHEHAGRAYSNLLSCAVRNRCPPLAKRYLQEGITYCEDHEVQDCLGYLRSHAAMFALHMGQWDQAAQRSSDLLNHHQLAVAQKLPAQVVLATVRARRGDPGVDALLDEAAQLALGTEEFQRIAPIASARAEVAWYRGDLDRVKQEAETGLRSIRLHNDRWLRGALMFWMHCANPAMPRPVGLAEPYSAMIEGDWRGAAQIWKKHEDLYFCALALSFGPEEALREALEILEPLGTGPLSAIVRQKLRELGVRGIPRGPRTSTRSNPAGLTAREVQVLKLLVHGHTNGELAHRLHLSPKTIDHHVSAILQKLEVRSRTEAVAAAFSLGILKASA